MLRRSLFWILTALAGAVFGYFVAWNPGTFGEGFGLVRSLGAMATFAAAIGFLVWAWTRPAGWKALAAFALGIGAAWLAAPLWATISWASFGWLLLMVIFLALLWVGTIMLRPGRFADWVARRLPARPPAPPTTTP